MLLDLDKTYYNLNKKKLIAKHIGTILVSFVLVYWLNNALPEFIAGVLNAIILLVTIFSLSILVTLTLNGRVPFDNTITYNTQTGFMRLPFFILFGVVRFPVRQATFLILREVTEEVKGEMYTTCFMEFRVLVVTLPIKLAINVEHGRKFYKENREELKIHGVELMYEQIK